MSLVAKLSDLGHQGKSIMKDFWNSSSWPKRPQALNVEITAACDARCIHCPRQDMDRPKRHMPLPLFKRMVDQAAEMGIPDLFPNGFGEILLIPNLEKYFEYIASQEHQFRMLINTNGHLMTDEKIDVFLRYGVYLLNITIDGATVETAQRVRLGLDTQRVEDNICRLLVERDARGLKHPKVRVGMIAIPENQHECQAFLNKWDGVADYVGIGGFSNRGGSVTLSENWSKETVHERHPCVLPFRELNVWADGKAVLCCDDWNAEYVVGDLNHETLAEIWTGPAMTKVRKLHMQSRGGEVGICGRCNFWRRPSAGARLWS